MLISIPSKWRWPAAASAIAVAIAITAVLLFAQQTAAAGTGVPGAPANPLAHLIVPEGGDPRVRVSWDAPDASVSGYTITRADGQAFQAAGTATTFSDHSVEPGTSYTYAVMARNAQGSSASSATAQASVPDAPSQPGELNATIAPIDAADEAATVTLSWQPSSVPAAAECETQYPMDGYTVLRLEDGQESEIAGPGNDVPSLTDDSAAFGTTYTYRVMARNAIGNSPAAEVTILIPDPPVQPATGLSASITDPFDGNVSLSWDAPVHGPEPAGYFVFRYDGTDDPYQGTTLPVTLADENTDNPETTWVDTGVQAGVTYAYLVLTRSEDNASGPSNTAVIEPPAPPSALTATPGEGAIDLSWPPPAAGTVVEYRVERQQQDGEWNALADITGTSHSDDTAQANVEHRYRVQHRNQYGGSTWTESEPVTLVTVPGQPTRLTAAVDGNDNLLSWTAPDHPFVDGYRVRHRTGEAQWRTLAEDVTDTGYRHTGAQADITHHYAVQAHNSAGDGPWSNPASAGRITPPSVPQNVSAELDGTDIVVSWERPGSVHVNGYTVRHQAGEATPVDSEHLSEAQTAFRMTDAAGDIAYRIAVRAHNDAGDSPWSEDVEIMRRLAPSAPTNVAVSVGETDIILSWETPAVGMPDGYHVQHGEQDSQQLQTESLTADQTSYTHSDNVEGVTYQYRVHAHNTAGQSPWSETLTATRTLAPQAPTGLAAEVSGSLITLSRTAPAIGIVDSYEVEYGVLDSDETSVETVDSALTSFEHIGAQGDVTHRYRVRSVNQAGQSSWAGPVEAMWVMPPTPPTGVAAAIDGNDILVTWNRPDGAFIDEYHLDHRQQDTEAWARIVVAENQTSHRHAGPTPGFTYEYRVRTVNAGGVSEWTTTVTGVWYNTAAPPAQFLYTPLGSGRILVKWTASPTGGVTHYQLRHNVDGGDWTEVRAPKRKSYHFAAWSEDQEYLEFQVRSRRDGQYGDWSPVSRAYIAIPDAVTTLQANLESGSGVRLHWEHPASGMPHIYRVQKLQDDGSYADTGGTFAGHVTTGNILDAPGATNTYRLVAVNHAGLKGEHEEAATVSVSIPEQETLWPDMPQNLTVAMLDPGTVRLHWYPPAEQADRVDSYRIYRKRSDDGRRLGDSYRDHVLVARTGNANTHLIDHTAAAGFTYEYGVAAYQNGELRQISNRAYARPWE